MTMPTMTPRTARTWIAACAGGLALVAASATAAGQVPTVQPDGTLADPGAPPPQPAPSPAGPPSPTVIVQQPDGTPQVVTPDGSDAGPQRFYFGDGDGGGKTTQNWNVKIHGPVPEHHVIRRGDTLWDISWLYFNNPWEWPKVWSYNPTITSPHWIYPGDLVRLYPQGEAPVVVAPVDPDEPIDVAAPAVRRTYAVQLRQLAYVDREKMKWSGTVAGSIDEKLMLSTGDQIYVDYPAGKPPKVGKRYAIYTVTQKVKHPDGKTGTVGSFVKILGELRVVSVKKDKRARAVIEEANDIIERGARVGPIQRRYRGDQVEPTPNTRNLTGTVLAMLTNDQLVGQGEIVFIDLGKKQGLREGNVLHIIRRGDAYPKTLSNKVGQNDTDFPSRSIGQVIVVDVGKNAAATMVITSRREFEVGDRVLMRRAN